ncbi:hypothetical protein SG34_010640 [Thalassomonas viridans]|uniref:Uncharacterized protein n=1 Tax=Thalassomonas viridans TaxID=137584 RepID=A0AAF0CAW4_9GAMM|nr:hypothetical protein [Thalassomonas viridans]WDE07303.1 hypothetical protein SG34_010640 [Thalassomonas viridans]
MPAQTPHIFQTAQDAYLNATKDAITHLHLVKDYLQSDSFVTVTGAKSVASIAISPADMAISTVDGNRTLVINPKSNLTKNNSSQKYVIGTASSGTTNSLTLTGAGWSVSAYERKVVHITGGTGAGESAKITGNTADTLSFDAGAFTVALDNTSEFEILDDISAVYVSSTEVVYACEEATDKAIDAASADQVSCSGASLALPALTNVAS